MFTVCCSQQYTVLNIVLTTLSFLNLLLLTVYCVSTLFSIQRVLIRPWLYSLYNHRYYQSLVLFHSNWVNFGRSTPWRRRHLSVRAAGRTGRRARDTMQVVIYGSARGGRNVEVTTGRHSCECTCLTECWSDHWPSFVLGVHMSDWMLKRPLAVIRPGRARVWLNAEVTTGRHFWEFTWRS